MKMVGLAFVLIAATSASNSKANDIVVDAANAIIMQDADTLKAMRFTASGLDRKRLSVIRLLERISQCRPLDRDIQLRPREIHFECDKAQDQGACDTNILVVGLERATSPHVFAHLRFKRLETSKCALPLPPG